MKTVLNISKVVVFVTTLTLVYSFSGGPKKSCDLDALFESNAATIQPYTFVKKFDVQVDKSGNKVEYSYVFSRDCEYKILIFDLNEEGKRMVINFLDRNKKLISTNYVKSSKKVFPSITYKCSATGVYYVEAYFEGEEKGCGINILGFKK